MIYNGCTDYLSDPGNYIDLVYIWSSIAMSLIHSISSPHSWLSKLLMIIVTLLAIRRTFNFLRIFQSLTAIVIMIQRVFVDLSVFLTVYTILCVMFSLMYGVLGLANVRIENGYKREFALEGSQPP
jgi:hypothetical protein